MQADSTDLRERVSASYATGQFTIAQVAGRFAVSVSFVDNLLERQRLGGHPAPARGPAPRLSEADRQCLSACAKAQPDATLDELGQHFVAARGPAGAVRWQTPQQVGWRRKKRAATPPSAMPSAEAACGRRLSKPFSGKMLPASNS